jgi:uncharacterized protein (DUF1800 family)
MSKSLKTSRGRSALSLFLIGFSLLSLSCHSPAATDELSVIPIYQDEYAAGVLDWSWTTTNPSATAEVFEGNYSLYGELQGWEGIYLNFQPAISVPTDGYLEYSIYSETSTEIAIRTSSAELGDGTQVTISVAAQQWQQESISLQDLGAGEFLSGIWWQQYSERPSGGVYLDNIRITKATSDVNGPFSTAASTSRFLSRATFGATVSDIDTLSGGSASDWFRQELGKPASSYLDITKAELQQPGAADPNGEPTFQGRTAPNFAFWKQAISAPDQLRQRMMYALSQILVISNSQSNLLFDRPTSVAAYQDILSRHALGNYRDLLEDVTYSTAMGEYLTYMQNRKGDIESGRMPDENYARELMQLFTIGLVELDMDGQPRLRNGEPIETYSNRDVSGLARVFTGMSYALDGFEPGFVPTTNAALSNPMVFFPEHHETGEKQFLGNTIPAGTGGEASITIALDALMTHPNTPPFIARQLIQRFVSSHPTPGYIRRVANAFAQGRFTLPDNSVVGEGRRGDLAATIAAILFDDEALAEPGVNPRSGKLREPVLRFTHWARAFDAKALTARHLTALWYTGSADALSQSPFRSPSVFNFYRPGYIAPGTETGAAGLTMPELQLVSASSVPGFVNFMQRFVFADGQRSNDQNIASSFIPNYTDEAALADTPVALVDRLNRVLAAGQLRPATQKRIADFLDTVPLSDPQQSTYDGRRQRAMHAVLMVMTATEYTVQF